MRDTAGQLRALLDVVANLAEGERFELSDGLPSPVFKTGAFGRSATPPSATIIATFTALRRFCAAFVGESSARIDGPNGGLALCATHAPMFAPVFAPSRHAKVRAKPSRETGAGASQRLDWV